MSTPDLPLQYVAHPPRRGGERPPLLVLLHGYGSNEDDLIGLAPYLDDRLLVVSARAPLMLMPGSYAWFEIGMVAGDDGRTQIVSDARQARLSLRTAAEFVAAAAQAFDADPARVLVGGFSQGASMAAMVALLHPELVSGAAVLSGIVPSEVLDEAPPAERLAGRRFLVSHGTADQVVVIDHGRATRALLEGMPVDMTYREYPGMGHEINAESLRDLQAWVRGAL